MCFDVVPFNTTLMVSGLEDLRNASHDDSPWMRMDRPPSSSSHISRRSCIKIERKPQRLVAIEVPVFLAEILCPKQSPNDGSMFAIDGSGFGGDCLVEAASILPFLLAFNEHDNTRSNVPIFRFGAISEEMEPSRDGGR